MNGCRSSVKDDFFILEFLHFSEEVNVENPKELRVAEIKIKQNNMVNLVLQLVNFAVNFQKETGTDIGFPQEAHEESSKESDGNEVLLTFYHIHRTQSI